MGSFVSSRGLKLKLEGFDFKGFAYARAGDRLVYVLGGIPGEEVRVRVLDRRRSVYQVIDVLSPHEARVEPRCPYYGVCGGCDWQHIRYDWQLKFKEKLLEKAFFGLEAEYHKIVPSPREWRYRGKCEFAFGRLRDGKLRVGFRERFKFWAVVDMEQCLLQHERCDEVMRVVRDFCEERKFSAWNPWKHKGFLRYLTLRSTTTGQVMANIITSSEATFPLEELAERIHVDSLIWSVSDSVADVAKGEVKKVIGSDHLIEKLMGFEFVIYPYSFFQSNPYAAEKLYKLVRDAAGDGGKVALDLYAGAAVIGILVSDLFEKVVAIEADEECVRAAKENLRRNDIRNVEVIHGEVEDETKRYPDADVAFVDPPRAGLSKHAMKALVAARPKRIVYVSCNVVSAARDIRILRIHGYTLREVTPIDLFPQTHHLELVAILERKE